jgi:protein-tyrosine phosphatase
MQMNKINDWLWIGDANDGKNIAAIDAAGIKAVWNATRETDSFPADVKRRIAYQRIDQDDGAPISFDKLDLFTGWLAVQGWHSRSILVHCGAGVSRAATFGTFALMICSGVSWEECLAAIRAKRPQVSPNPVLKQSVMEWWAARCGELCEYHRMPPPLG